METNAADRVILVTGATGFVGQHTVKLLLQKKWRVRALVHNPVKRAVLPPAAEIVEGDLLLPRTLSAAIDGVTDIIHGAALMSNYDHMPRQKFYEVNVEGTNNLLAALAGNKDHQAIRFVHISTAGVLGPTPEDGADENFPYGRTLSNYEWSKMESEKVVKRYQGPWIILRPSQLYGPGMTYGWLDVAQKIQHRNFYLLGPGTAKIHPAHISDITRGIELAMLRGNFRDRQSYLLAGPNPVTLKDCFKTLSKCLDRPEPISIPYAPVYWAAMGLSWLPSSLRPASLKLLSPHRVRFFRYHRVYKTNQAYHQLGYQAEISVGQGFPEMIKCYRDQGLLKSF
ncbi:MAG: NAD-dependent epimerase/dehydratase family protein [Elusimicrobia bacterium]|nr:NAD-dependent epimerase/dehydratase family protein [Elusimicrobiota bacterium]